MNLQTLKEKAQLLSRAEQAELTHFLVDLLAGEEGWFSKAWREFYQRQKDKQVEESLLKLSRKIMDEATADLGLSYANVKLVETGFTLNIDKREGVYS